MDAIKAWFGRNVDPLSVEVIGGLAVIVIAGLIALAWRMMRSKPPAPIPQRRQAVPIAPSPPAISDLALTILEALYRSPEPRTLFTLVTLGPNTHVQAGSWHIETTTHGSEAIDDAILAIDELKQEGMIAAAHMRNVTGAWTLTPKGLRFCRDHFPAASEYRLAP
jgi:hypothetical protein